MHSCNMHDLKALKRVHRVFRGITSIAVHDRNAFMTPLLPYMHNLRKSILPLAALPHYNEPCLRRPRVSTLSY